jgi:hypothetical protein
VKLATCKSQETSFGFSLARVASIVCLKNPVFLRISMVLRHLLGRMSLLEIFSLSLSASGADQGFSEFC